MVTLAAIRASNALIPTALPESLVAVFVGATKGIGEASLKAFAKNARKPRVYFVGRSADVGKRVREECEALNPEGTFVFVRADVTLIKNVDEVCREIRGKETVVNLLFQSQGSLVFRTETSEKLHMAFSLAYYSRMRFILNLLPCLRAAPALRRVVSVFAGAKEGPIHTADLPGWNLGLTKARGHGASMQTLGLESIAKQAPEVGFVHGFPGAVKTTLMDDMPGLIPYVVRPLMWVLGPFVFISAEECGERHAFFATSARFAAKKAAAAGAGEKAGVVGVPLLEGVVTARGTDGAVGSGVYSVESDGGSAGSQVETVLAGLRRDGVREMVWEHTEAEFRRITGVVSI